MSEEESSVLALAASCEWAKHIAETLRIEIFAFGSLIYEDGEQFDPKRSDLDFVALFTESKTAWERATSLVDLRAAKSDFELKLIKLLRRTNCSEAAISLVPVTRLEIGANIHKSDSRQFFDTNFFLHLPTNQKDFGFKWENITVNDLTVTEPVRQALAYIQKTRNEFLALSANGSGGIIAFDGDDPIPKSLARVAAQVAKSSGDLARYDTRIGLDHIYDLLSRFAEKDAKYFSELQKKISVRRGARGRRYPLTDFDQLILAEILYDTLTSTDPEPNEIREIKFLGVSRLESDRYTLLLNRLRDFIPGVVILSESDGCILLRVRSSRRSFQNFLRLDSLGILAKFFEIDDLQISDALEAGQTTSFSKSEPVSRAEISSAAELSLEIISRIKDWHPSNVANARFMDEEFRVWLDEVLKNLRAKNLQIEKNPRIVDQNGRFNFDVRVSFAENESELFIELLRIRNKNGFFAKIERIRDFSRPVILVVVGESEVLASLKFTFIKTQEAFNNISILTVEIGEKKIPWEFIEDTPL